MYIHKRKEIMKALRAELKRKKYGFGADQIDHCLKAAINDLDGDLKYESGRNSVEHATGIKIRRMGLIIF